MPDYKKRGALLIDTYDRLINEMKATDTRINKFDSEEGQELRSLVYTPLEDIVSVIQLQLHELCSDSVPVYQLFTKDIDGIDAVDTMKLITYLKDPERFETVSKVWKYSGFAPVMLCKRCNKIQRYCNCEVPRFTYVAERQKKGKAKSYNKDLKKALVAIGDRIILDDPFYRKAYYTYRTEEINKSEYLSPRHIHNRAKRKVIKLFAFHFINAWRLTEGIPPLKPYMSLPAYEKILGDELT
jgi:hypothetical protein